MSIGGVSNSLGVSATNSNVTGLGFNGNQLNNFFNKNLIHGNGHKTIFYVGNSTVWNATQWYIEFLNSFTNAGLLQNLNLTPVTTAISGYQVLDNAGTIQVTLTGSVPAAYAVGDLILSQPVLAGLNTLIGTGVITAINGSVITYTLISFSTLPTITAFTSSSGYLTNSLVNLGQNGATSSAIATTVTPILQKYAAPGDLVLVRGGLINDVRLGATNLSQAVQNVTALYNTINRTIPATCDIAWKTENSLLTTDPTSSGLVSPLASSAAYTKIIHDAVPIALQQNANSRVVFWDNMQLVYSKLGFEYATSAWMTDILHPNANGQKREAAADYQVISGLLNGLGLSSLNSLNDPYGNTGSNASVINGTPATLNSYRALAGFSPILGAHAMADNYSAPWTLYPDIVLDPDRFDIIVYGTVGGFSQVSGFINLSHPAPVGGTVSEIQQNDVVWMLGSGVFQVPSGFAQAPLNNASAVYGYQLSNLGSSLVPSSTYVGQPVVIARQKSYNLLDVPYYNDPRSYPYRHRVFVPASGTNFLRIQYIDGTPSWPTALTTSDVLVFPGGSISLAGASFAQFSNYVQINLTGSFAAYQGSTGWAFGSHNTEAYGVVGTFPQLYGVKLTAKTAAGTAIASATTIAPTQDIHLVSGTTAISTITVPANFSGGAGQITLVPTGLWTTATGGNIALASTAVVNKALIMTYDSTSALWYPSY